MKTMREQLNKVLAAASEEAKDNDARIEVLAAWNTVANAGGYTRACRQSLDDGKGTLREAREILRAMVIAEVYRNVGPAVNNPRFRNELAGRMDEEQEKALILIFKDEADAPRRAKAVKPLVAQPNPVRIPEPAKELIEPELELLYQDDGGAGA